MPLFERLNLLPGQARLWLYASDRPLTPEEEAQLIARFEGFAAAWSSHGRTVTGLAEIADSRVLGIAAWVEDGDISGCGIDKSVHAIHELSAELGFSWLAGLNVVWRDGTGAIRVGSRRDFREQVASGAVTGDTPVIDLSATYVGDLPGVERPAAESWHAQVFGLSAQPREA